MKKCVLVGGPCSGKSTTIDILKQRGYLVLEEVAKRVLEERKDIEVTREEIIKRNEIMFLRQISEEKEYEKRLGRNDWLFLDRGVDDVIVYSNELLGFIPERIDLNAIPVYDEVLLLERFPFERQGFRIERDDAQAELIHKNIAAHYSSRYDVVNIPKMEAEKRVDYILNLLEKQDL